MNALEQRHRKRSANREAPARRGDLRVGTSRRGPAGAIVEAATKMLRVPEFFEETGYLTLSHRATILQWGVQSGHSIGMMGINGHKH